MRHKQQPGAGTGRHANRTPADASNAAAAEWRAHAARLRRRDRDALPERLGPPEVFSAERAGADERRRRGLEVPEAETGRNSRTVAGRLRMSCAGWRRVPTAAEFHDAIHDPAGTGRERAILLVWCHEAHVAEQVQARLEGAYAWRDLAEALHRAGLTGGEAARRINRFARR